MQNSRRPLPPSIQQSYLTDPRLALAQELARTGSSTAPVSTPLEGLARALQGGLAGYQRSQVDKEYGQRADDYNATLSEALRSGDVPMDQRIEGLSSNPDTASIAQQLQMEKFKGQMDMEKNQALLSSLGLGQAMPMQGGAPSPVAQPGMGSEAPPMAAPQQPPVGTGPTPQQLQAASVMNPAMGNALVGAETGHRPEGSNPGIPAEQSRSGNRREGDRRDVYELAKSGDGSAGEDSEI